MLLKAGVDLFGDLERFTSIQFRRILDLIDGYMGAIPYNIAEIRQDNILDPLGRIDVEVRFEKNGLMISQKLLILNDELIDGKTFHSRYEELYGKEEWRKSV